LISDASLFLLNCRSIIEKAPLQLYHSAILFSPENSLIRQNFLCSKESEISLYRCFSIFPRYENWVSSTQRRKYDLVGHTGRIGTFSFSPCGKILASSSYDGTVRIWNLTTGQCSQTITIPGRLVKAMLVLDGGDQLAVGSQGGEIGLWNPAEREYPYVPGH
jgi:WD40 repeat protein